MFYVTNLMNVVFSQETELLDCIDNEEIPVIILDLLDRVPVRGITIVYMYTCSFFWYR